MIIPGSKLFENIWRPRLVLIVLALFLLLRLPGLDLPYHQDEWKNVGASASHETAKPFFTHPPLFQILFVGAHEVFGEDWFRLFPLLVSVMSGILLFIVAKSRYGQKAALFSVLLFSICFYSVLGSLQPDVEGSILPFLFLICVLAYDRFLEKGPYSRKWLLLLVAVLLVGLLIKLNFILVIGVLFADYAWLHRSQVTVKRGIIWLGSLVGFGILYVACLYFIQNVYPYFVLSGMIGHANQFTGNEGRSYLQIIVQASKAVYYLSPLLLVPLIWIDKEIIRKSSVFIFFLVFGFFFYFVAFDFSRGVLDKYLMFSIVPLSAIVGAILSDVFKYSASRTDTIDAFVNMFSGWKALTVGIVISIGLIAINFLPQNVAALYPKTEWFSRVLQGKWNVLTPFTGGSGPAGFYVSFLFIAAVFLVSFAVAVVGLYRPSGRRVAGLILVLIGVSYNVFFIEELIVGRVNGNVSDVINNVADFIGSESSVIRILTFNDTGNREFGKTGKYGGRFYAVPQFEEGLKLRFSEYDHYVVVDIPHLYENGFYGKFFSGCSIMYETASGRIPGRVYDCSVARKALIEEINKNQL